MRKWFLKGALICNHVCFCDGILSGKGFTLASKNVKRAKSKSVRPHFGDWAPVVVVKKGVYHD